MKMPDKINDNMLAPCGINCAVCYKRVGIRKHAKSCEGCLDGGKSISERRQKRGIKNCVQEKDYMRCLECADFLASL
jgi:hypothetical protein